MHAKDAKLKTAMSYLPAEQRASLVNKFGFCKGVTVRPQLMMPRTVPWRWALPCPPGAS